jgi:predicted dehydrogenase
LPLLGGETGWGLRAIQRTPEVHRMMKIGIAGAGFAARYHFDCLNRVHSVPVEVVGVTSLTRKSRESFAQQRGIKAFSSFDELIDAVDVVDICTPPYVHEEMIVQAAERGRDVIVEKPLTGYFGPAEKQKDFSAYGVPRREMLSQTIASLIRIDDAVRRSGIVLGYAENFVYALSVQKEREIVEKSGAQILRMIGEESHNGSASPVYGMWKFSGGGSLMGKGCHPLGAILYLKRVEGIARDGSPIRPATVSARVHEITRLDNYEDKGFLRTDYDDVEDYGFMHVVFEDGTIGHVVSCELVLGGIYDWVEVYANNHRARCRISPTNLVDAYSPSAEQFRDIYLMEKISTQEGWVSAAPDENLTMGYQPELQDFVESINARTEPQSGLPLAIDTTLTIYAAYVSAERGGAEVGIPLNGFAD